MLHSSRIARPECNGKRAYRPLLSALSPCMSEKSNNKKIKLKRRITVGLVMSCDLGLGNAAFGLVYITPVGLFLERFQSFADAPATAAAVELEKRAFHADLFYTVNTFERHSSTFPRSYHCVQSRTLLYIHLLVWRVALGLPSDAAESLTANSIFPYFAKKRGGAEKRFPQKEGIAGRLVVSLPSRRRTKTSSTTTITTTSVSFLSPFCSALA